MSLSLEHVASKDGTSIAYQRSGAGPALVLVHGTTADHTRWSGVSPRFEGHFTVHAMDRRGRGGSGDAPEYEFMREAEDVAAVVEAACERAGEPACVIGHSYGGLCSLEAARLTGMIGRLILYEPDVPTGVSPFSPTIVDRLQALIDECDQEAALVLLLRELVEMPDHELEAFRQQPVWQVRIQLAHTIPRELAVYWTYKFDADRFASLQTPTLLLVGGDSPPSARQAIETVAAALPGSRIVSMPGQGHIAMDTNPELFAKEVLQFLLV